MRVFGDLSRANGRRYPDKIALRHGDDTLTYSQLDARSNQLAHALIGMGVGPKDRVALLAYNRLDYAIVTQGAAKCGALLAPMNFRLAIAEIRHLLTSAEPKVLVMEAGFADAVAKATEGLTPPALIVLPDGKPIPDGAVTLDQACADQPASDPAVPVEPSDPCLLMYTSGTTGLPKGVVMPHEHYFRIFLATATEASLRHDDVYLMAVPMFHNAGMNMMLNQCLFMGATGIVHSGSFNPDEVLSLIARHKVTFAVQTPTTVGMLAFHEGVENHDLSSLDKIFYGSMPITPRILEQALKVFPNVAFTQLYGTTEAGMLGVLRWADHDRWSQTTGHEALLAEIRIVDDEGRDVAVGEVGEVIGAKAMMGMIGYWRNQEATAKTIRNGWIYTGDLARVEGEGFFTLVDRRNDVIISGGENIYPKEVEDALNAHPAVHEVSVFGVPHELFGQSVCAAVAFAPGMSATTDDLIAFCRERIAGYKIPRRIEVMDALPRNASDKIQKAELKTLFGG